MTKSRATFTAWPWTKWVWLFGNAAWVATIPVWALSLLLQIKLPLESWLLDWHVYAAAAGDLLDRTLYAVPLQSPFLIPVDAFNYPPLSALAVVPLLGFPDQLAGTLWVVINIVAVAGTALLLTRCLAVQQPDAWAGIAFAAFTIHPWAWFVTLGNNSPIVLFVVMASLLAYLRDRPRLAGTLLGVAIGMKVWPAALVPLLIRERSWKALAWTAGVVAMVAVGSAVWLGPRVVGDLFAALQVHDEVEPGNIVLGVSWLRETFDWWPVWGGYAVAAALMALPVRRRTGIGLGLLAGMAAIPNLWVHYLPTVIAGFLFVASGPLADRRSAILESFARPARPARSPRGRRTPAADDGD